MLAPKRPGGGAGRKSYGKCWVLLFVLGVVTPRPGFAETTIIDFEGLPDRAQVTTQFANLGVTFSGANILTCGISLNCPTFPPFSGTKVIFDFPVSFGGVVTGNFDLNIAGNVRSVSARVTGNTNVTLTAFNASGAVLDSTQTGGPNCDLPGCSGLAVVGPPNLLLTVESSGESIAQVTFVDAGNTFTIDDFTFESDVLEFEWFPPPANEELGLGKTYEIRLDVTNPGPSTQVATFSLGQIVGATSGTFEWPPDFETVMLLDGLPYQPGDQVSQEIPGDATREFVFRVNNAWNWIEPWNAGRFEGIVSSLVFTFPGLEVAGLIDTLNTILSFVDNVGEVTYEYIGIGDSQTTTFSAVVTVTPEKAFALGSSVLIGIAAGKATGAGVTALFTGIGAAGAPALFLAEAAGIAAAEIGYAIAADPQVDFTELALAQPVPIPEECLPTEENTSVGEVAELYSQLLGLLEALSQSYIRFDAAENAESLEGMALHLALIQLYTEQMTEVSQVLVIVLQELVSSIPVPDDPEIAAIRQVLVEAGLPELELCVLTAFGYTPDELEELEVATAEFPDDFFVNFLDLPITLARSSEALATLATMPTLPAESAIASIDFDPDTLNMNSNGQWVTVYIELPEEFDVGAIECSSLRLLGDIAPVSCQIGDHDNDGVADLRVKFNRGATIAALETGFNVVPLTGSLTSGPVIGGIDIVRVIGGE